MAEQTLELNGGRCGECEKGWGGKFNLWEHWKIVAAAGAIWFVGVNLSAHNARRYVRGAAASAASNGLGAIDPWYANRALALCRSMNVGRVSVRLMASTAQSRMKNGAVVDTISIDCRTERGSHVASILMDAQSGQLISLGCIPEHRAAGGAERMARDAAVRTAWQWMRETRIAEQADRWRVDAATQLANRQWQVWFVSGERRAVMQMDGCTGALYAARTYLKSAC